MMKDKWQQLTKKELAERAKRKGIANYGTLSKEALIAALAALAAAKRSKSTRSRRSGLTPAKKIAPQRRRPQLAAAHHNGNGSAVAAPLERSHHNLGAPTGDLSAKAPKEPPAGPGKDRIVCMVRDPYWLHCYWELTRQAVERAEAALAQSWHGARPILRVFEVNPGDSANLSETMVRDIEIHGGANHWYVEAQQPPRTYRIDIGYRARDRQFYVLARSNIVSTPRAGGSDVIDENWADLDGESARHIYAMSAGFDPMASSLELKQLFEERLRRPMGTPALTSFGSGACHFGKQRRFWFQLDAELIVYGSTDPHAKVTLHGEPIKLRDDGTFTMRFSLPDSRQIIPAVAMSADGIEERTIVLAIERNTRQLEPIINEPV